MNDGVLRVHKLQTKREGCSKYDNHTKNFGKTARDWPCLHFVPAKNSY